MFFGKTEIERGLFVNFDVRRTHMATMFMTRYLTIEERLWITRY